MFHMLDELQPAHINVSRTQTNFYDTVFWAAAPLEWNYLPADVRQPDLSHSNFKQSQKTFLFGQWDQSAARIHLY